MTQSGRSRVLLAGLGCLILGAGAVSVHLHNLVSDARTVHVTAPAAIEEFDPSLRSALIVIDVQNDFWIPEVASSNPHFEERLAELLAACRSLHVPIIHVRTQYDEHLDNWPTAFLATHRQSKLCLTGTNGEQALTCALEIEGEKLFSKGNFDAFSNREFSQYLENSGIQQIYVCGLYTDVCVLSTSLSAFNRGLHVTLISDCCASMPSTHEFVMGRYADFIFSVRDQKSVIADFSRQD